MNIKITTILKPIDVKVDGIIILFKDRTLLNMNGPNTVRPLVKNTYVRDKQDWNVDSPRNKNNIMRRFYYFIIFIIIYKPILVIVEEMTKELIISLLM